MFLNSTKFVADSKIVKFSVKRPLRQATVLARLGKGALKPQGDDPDQIINQHLIFNRGSSTWQGIKLGTAIRNSKS